MGEEILVGIVMGSSSDSEGMKEAAQILDRLHIAYEINIISAHRTPDEVHEYAVKAEERGLEVIIAGAGGSAHLAGVIASLTPLPVIGVPMETDSLGGMDSLLSTVQMPSGVPVATMGIGRAGAKNAGILAAQILGVKYPRIRREIKDFKKQLAEEVKRKGKDVNIKKGKSH